MFQWFRSLLEVAEDLTEALVALNATLAGDLAERQEGGKILDRVEAIERGQAQWEAEIDGVLLKADGKLKAANNAEARERTMRSHYENLFDEFDQEGQTGIPPNGVSADDAEASEEEGVHPLHLGVAPVSPKEFAMRAKFS